MKIMFLFFTISFLVPVTVSAGTAAHTAADITRHYLSFGGGLNLSSTDKSDTIGLDVSNLIGFNAGMDYEYILSHYVSLMPGLSLETRGEKWVAIENTEEVEGFSRFLYVQVPLLAKLSIPFFFDENRISLFGGPEAGVFLSRTVSQAEFDVSEDELGKSRRIDYGLTTGASLEMRAGTGAVVFSCSFYKAFYSSVSDNPATLGDEGVGEKHRNIKIKGAYIFRLSGR